MAEVTLRTPGRRGVRLSSHALELDLVGPRAGCARITGGQARGAQHAAGGLGAGGT